MIYLIKENRHNSQFCPKITFNKTIKGTFKFISGYDYSIDKQGDSNKLIGLSDNWHHHLDSVRIGWRFNPMKPKFVELVYIVYKNGVRTISPITYVYVNKEYYFKIEIFEDSYIITVNDKKIGLERTSKWFGPRYLLKPYFGGTTKSPKNILIDITLKKN